jgi:hypothetical protein
MLGVVVRAAGRQLLWLGLLAITATAAIGMTTASAGAESLAGLGASTTIVVERPVSIEPCDLASTRMLQYAVSNGWIPADFGGYCHNA